MSASIRSSMKDFHLMVSGQIITILGSTLLRFALSLYVLDITGRADIFAGLYAVTSIPFLLAPLGGAIADRFNRRNLMVIFDFINAAIVLSFIILLFTGPVSIILIGTIMFLLAVVSAMYSPVVMASIPQLVPENKLEQANERYRKWCASIIEYSCSCIRRNTVRHNWFENARNNKLSCFLFICDFRNVY
ncbi:MFS family permease [Bacillus sp. RC236]